jgi:hypothetical protein
MTDEATRMPQESFTDKIGQTVRVGDVIAYTHAEGRSATLRIGKVLGINEVHTKAPSWEADWGIRIRGVRESKHEGPSLHSREGTLRHPDRIIKLPVVPDAIAKLLEGV